MCTFLFFRLKCLRSPVQARFRCGSGKEGESRLVKLDVKQEFGHNMCRRNTKENMIGKFMDLLNKELECREFCAFEKHLANLGTPLTSCTFYPLQFFGKVQGLAI
ncbi:Uncharacterized protein Adt_19302 [Abeliophyllum distichum]|uniref:Uncharacterized protein n=1 Tax=Abeliophyllum distichum TaxID=126358 RepID=A0ABD1SSJ6_9LAMI